LITSKEYDSQIKERYGWVNDAKKIETSGVIEGDALTNYDILTEDEEEWNRLKKGERKRIKREKKEKKNTKTEKNRLKAEIKTNDQT
jgi:hypothetical protein